LISRKHIFVLVLFILKKKKSDSDWRFIPLLEVVLEKESDFFLFFLFLQNLLFLDSSNIIEENLFINDFSLMEETKTKETYALDAYFDDTTMSLHLKADRPILRKKGFPGNWQAVLDEKIISKEELESLVNVIIGEATKENQNFIEIDRKLSKVIQLGNYRIVIVYPPLSDGLEITAVRPVKKTNIEDYHLSDETFDLLRNKAKGILVSGAPGSGKSTFVQALVQVLHADHHIIKTVESPRDLMVDEDVVQYSFTHGTHDEVRDILLLSRPDYTIYDEVRNKPDFELYKDLRLT
jgi:ATPase